MLRIISTAAMISVLLAIAAPRARGAIAELHSEFATADALGASAVISRPRVYQQPHWVAVADYDVALARISADK